VSRKAGQARRASIDVDFESVRPGGAAGLRLLLSIIGLDGSTRLFNIEQVDSQE
jgi:hypothetical protein